MDNKQKAGDNSSNTINYITNNIHNDEKFIRDTCGDVCKEMLKDLTDDAFNTSLVLKGDFEDNLIKNLADKTINLEKFKSPGTQILLVKIFSEYFKNPTEQVKEILIKIIVNILKEENRSRKSILLDKSVELIGLLSSDDIRKIYFFI